MTTKTINDITTETQIIGLATVTRSEGPGWYEYREWQPMGVEYYPRRNGLKIHFWLILTPQGTQDTTIDWLNRKGYPSVKYGKYIKISWADSKRGEVEKNLIQEKLIKRLREIYRPQN